MASDDHGQHRNFPANCEVFTRRTFLRAGGLGALNLLWLNWQRLHAGSEANPNAKAKSVILIFNAGAPSHLDLWDMKPNAPETVRGLFKPIATPVPGLYISELMPHVAGHAAKLAV